MALAAVQKEVVSRHCRFPNVGLQSTSVEILSATIQQHDQRGPPLEISPKYHSRLKTVDNSCKEGCIFTLSCAALTAVMIPRICAALFTAMMMLNLVPYASCAKKTSMSKFILAVHDGYDPHEVATEINHRGVSEADDWYGSVEKTHSMIKVLIINGKSNTCEVLHDVDGVKTCEADSVVSVHD